MDLTFNTATGCDIEKTRQVILDVIALHPLALKDPAPFVRFSAHKESSLEFTTRIWVKSADYWTVYFDMREAVEVAFAKNGIETPYPQVDVNLKNAK